MEEQITGLKSLLQSLAEESQSQAGDHLEPENLVAYHFKKLPSDEAGQVQGHLVMCRQCTALLLDLAAFCAPAEDESKQSTESEAAWAGLQALLQTSPQARQSPGLSQPSFFQRLRELTFPARLAYALAILSLALSLALGFWLISVNRENQALIARMNEGRIAGDQDGLASQKALAESAKETEAAQQQRDEARKRAEQLEAELDRSRRRIDEMMSPQLNAPVVDLTLGNTRARGDEIPIIDLPASADRFTLVITSLTPELNYSDYAIEIINQRGATILTRKGLRNDPEGGFTIALPCRLLPAGEYRFNVYGLSLRGRTLVSEGVSRIRYK